MSFSALYLCVQSWRLVAMLQMVSHARRLMEPRSDFFFFRVFSLFCSLTDIAVDEAVDSDSFS